MTIDTFPPNRQLCQALNSRCVDTDRHVSVASIITFRDRGNVSLHSYYVLKLQVVFDDKKRDEGVPKLNYRDLHDVIFSVLIKSRRMERVRHVPFTGEIRNAHTILVYKSKENRPLERPRGGTENNTKMTNVCLFIYQSCDW